MADKLSDAEAIRKLRENLIDLIALCERTPCSTVDELIGCATLALENDGQARMILAAVTQKR